MWVVEGELNMDRFLCRILLLISAGLRPINLVLNYEHQDFSTVLTFTVLVFVCWGWLWQRQCRRYGIAVSTELCFLRERSLTAANTTLKASARPRVWLSLPVLEGGGCRVMPLGFPPKPQNGIKPHRATDGLLSPRPRYCFLRSVSTGLHLLERQLLVPVPLSSSAPPLERGHCLCPGPLNSPGRTVRLEECGSQRLGGNLCCLCHGSEERARTELLTRPLWLGGSFPSSWRLLELCALWL